MFELTILAMGSERHGAVDLLDEQGSNGNSLHVVDGPDPEVMVAYPDVNGPIPSPAWEVMRIYEKPRKR